MGLLTKIGCFLIGWNPLILKDCGEASHRTFKRLISAIIIMMILWGTIGFCFAENYVNIESLLGKLSIMFVFMVLILCIERFIILTVGKLGWTGFFRVVLAIVMAALGSTIFDQIIFKNDVSVKMTETREVKVQKAIKSRMLTFDEDIKRYTEQIDSLGSANIVIYERLSKSPVIKTTDVVTQDVPTGQDENGIIKMSKSTTVTTRSVENPLKAQAVANENQLKVYQAQLKQLQDNKLNIDKDVRADFAKKKTGFLEELAALFALLGDDNIALIFYIILFVFLMSLELLVVTSRGGDTRCDYDLIVEHQLNVKKEMLIKSENRLLNK